MDTRGIATVFVGGLGVYLLVVGISMLPALGPVVLAGRDETVSSLELLAKISSEDDAALEEYRAEQRAATMTMMVGAVLGVLFPMLCGCVLVRWRQEIADRWVSPSRPKPEEELDEAVLIRVAVGVAGLALVVWSLSELLGDHLASWLFSWSDNAERDAWVSLIRLGAGTVLLVRPGLLLRLWKPRHEGENSA